jgi:channel protein (hemolysin III family)
LLVAALVLVAAIRVLSLERHRLRRAVVGVFAAATIVLFGLSGAYHMLEANGAARAVLQRADHAAIFLMIAGTFTAVHGVAFRGRWRGTFLLVVWVLALAGLTVKTVFFHAMPEWFGLSLYLALGWVGILSAWALWQNFGWDGARALLLGGVAYSSGAAYDFFRGPAWVDGVIGAHEVFHLSVVVGAVCHWKCVSRLITLSTEP